MSAPEPAATLRILAADIGGTHSRFAACTVDATCAVRQGPVFRMSTHQSGTSRFADLWARFRSTAPDDLDDPDAFDAIALAVAGSVDGERAVLPNVGWNLAPADFDGLGRVFLLNDFVAQGYALAASPGTAPLQPVRPGPDSAGCIALVGSGTGLGHCALYPGSRDIDDGLSCEVVSSEAGHAAFAFRGARERAIEDVMLREVGKHWLSNDDVVSGPGAERLHTALTGERLGAPEALAEAQRETADCFARFYARACRNYCLNVFPVGRLVLSGGLAARNPHLVQQPVFRQEFDDGGDYRELLHRIPIWLNTDQEIGIRGAAVFAARNLRQDARAAG